MALLMLSKDVLKNFHKLPATVQKNVSEVIGKFQNDPYDKSLHLHSLKEMMADSKVRGIDFPHGYRGIVIAPEKGDTFLLMHIDKHDDAYNWAKNKHFQVNQSSGLFQVFDLEVVKHVFEDNFKNIPKAIDYPLAKLSDEDLFQACVPKELFPSIRAIDSDEKFEALADYLPSDCREILCGIAAGMTLNQALEETLGKLEKEIEYEKPQTTGDFTNLQNIDNFDLVLVKDQDDFKDILEKSLEEWRIFLHPKQKKLVRWETKGPMNINGAAGTGKTVALMHRAIHLANTLENSKDKILITTFTTNLAITIQKQLKQLNASLAERIDVIDLYSMARSTCRRAGFKGNMGDADNEEELSNLWAQVWADKELGIAPLGHEEMIAEFNEIIEPNGLIEEDDYLTIVRPGRKLLKRPGRKIAWQFFNAFRRLLKKRNILTPNGAIHQARLSIEQKKVKEYRHILVDEVQDFNLEALRLICALSPIAENLSNPLCTVGDGHQRVYKNKIPLSRAGIDIRGRSRRLKINCQKATTIGDMSVMKGPEPEIIKCKDEAEEAKLIVNWLQKLPKKSDDNKGFADHEICITPYKEKIVSALKKSGYDIVSLKAHQTDPGEDDPGIRFGDMTRIKGLEYRVIVMACADEKDPLNNLANADVTDKCLRYVAATRARERLLVTLFKSK